MRMRVHSIRLWLPTAMIVLLLAPAASALTVTFWMDGELHTSACDIDPCSMESVYPATVPYSYTSSSIDGGAWAISEYDFSHDGFTITFDHSRLSTYQSAAYGWGFVYFSVDANVGYTATGSYSATDPGGGLVYLYASLNDYDLGPVFSSSQTSDSTPNESFALGLSEGDSQNSFSGSLTGTLVAGHLYLFDYATEIFTTQSSISGATATGFISLTFIPEPSTALVLTLGLVGIAAKRRYPARPSW